MKKLSKYILQMYVDGGLIGGTLMLLGHVALAVCAAGVMVYACVAWVEYGVVHALFGKKIAKSFFGLELEACTS